VITVSAFLRGVQSIVDERPVYRLGMDVRDGLCDCIGLVIGSIAGTGRKIGDIIAFELSRPSTDSFTGDAFLHSIGIHYQSDTIGSRQMSVK
jgi:hypothetical protein